jgi:hypothetical protein
LSHGLAAYVFLIFPPDNGFFTPAMKYQVPGCGSLFYCSGITFPADISERAAGKSIS